mmetsp:Transcript_27129/g.37761  ORF Transcript_27129/g.37761 Transcript_27129/m.37761 type:complete len:216 (-) Transcript_27129:142-789(-)
MFSLILSACFCSSSLRSKFLMVAKVFENVFFASLDASLPALFMKSCACLSVLSKSVISPASILASARRFTRSCFSKMPLGSIPFSFNSSLICLAVICLTSACAFSLTLAYNLNCWKFLLGEPGRGDANGCVKHKFLVGSRVVSAKRLRSTLIAKREPRNTQTDPNTRIEVLERPRNEVISCSTNCISLSLLSNSRSSSLSASTRKKINNISISCL